MGFLLALRKEVLGKCWNSEESKNQVSPPLILTGSKSVLKTNDETKDAHSQSHTA